MLQNKLKEYHIILASGSPRRQELIKDLNIDFEIRLNPIDEVYPSNLKHAEISDYLAKLKTQPFLNDLKEKDILITSDTIVWHMEQAVGKPKDNNDAFNMIRSFSNATHEVISSVCLTTTSNQKIVNAITSVTFKQLSDEEIWFYVNNYECLDKAGAYGIQDWIGKIAVTKLEGSYFNVMGFPSHLVYSALQEIVEH